MQRLCPYEKGEENTHLGGGHRPRSTQSPRSQKRPEGASPGASGRSPALLISAVWPPDSERSNICCL